MVSAFSICHCDQCYSLFLIINNLSIDALEDLNTGLKLCGGKGKTGCLLLCQRGVVYRAQEEQEKARDDFTKASDMGSAFAKQQVF